jgi:chaperone modulatory protein CbpM
MDIEFLDDDLKLALDELATRSGLAVPEIVSLVEYGVFEPLGATGEPARWTFSVRMIKVARRAARLRRELELDDPHAVAVALTLLERIDSLEGEVRELRCQLLRV